MNGVQPIHVHHQKFGHPRKTQVCALFHFFLQWQNFFAENMSTKLEELIAQNPDLSPADRQQMLTNLQVLVLANNRRVDVTLSTTGQQSVRGYPFNAKDYLALINPKGVEKKPLVKKKPKR